MITILIADDHAVLRRGIREILISAIADLKAVEAGDTNEAISLLMAQPFDLVLLDINMPGRSGFDVLEECRRLHLQMPVLVLSAYPEEEFAIRSLRLGAAGYLNKQSASDQLVAAVRKVLAGGKYVTSELAERCAEALGGELDQEPHDSLSSRELQVLRWIASGKTIKAIATELSLSEKTVATYRARISAKMGRSTNVELTRYALQHRLVD